ncbi:hypothetical protein T4E_3797 [Trichinella pseudospiralis]|uniref:Uncharacterized protein n=1 Tax=Trichinella pseudospiralis TaxID=6337 RepID=A0A0V0XD02_TRIPS|nr:hypothetical protein T4E_3797 [Trichinella pseudospiralis]
MDATKRITGLFNEYIFCSLGGGYMFSNDHACGSCYCQALTLIFGSACIGVAVDVDVMQQMLVFNPGTKSVIFRG